MAATDSIATRPFRREDVGELLNLMKGLAEFEGYIDRFRVTEADLIRHGLGPDPRFEAFVAQRGGEGPLLGTAVVYLVPWTYDLRPTMILKELFVVAEARGTGVGGALMRHVARRAVELDCPRVGWTVLETNRAGATFYRGLGALEDAEWDTWGLDEAAIAALAGSRS